LTCSAGISLVPTGSTDVFLKVDGIDGDSVDSTHNGEIDVLSFSWGGICRSGSSSAAQFLPLIVTKHTDGATSPLLTAAAAGNVIANVKLTVRAATGGATFNPLVIELNNVTVIGGGDELSLAYDAIKVTQTGLKEDGTAKPASVFGWDVAANQPL